MIVVRRPPVKVMVLLEGVPSCDGGLRSARKWVYRRTDVQSGPPGGVL